MPIVKRKPEEDSATQGHLHISLDVGTHWTKAIWFLDKPGANPASTKDSKNGLLSQLQTIHFQNRSQVKTQAVWDREERKLRFGDAVDEYFRRYPDRPESDRIIFLKLGICETSEDNPNRLKKIQDRHTTQLAEIAKLRLQGEPTENWSFPIDDAILKYLEWVLEHTEESILHTLDIQDVRLQDRYDVSCTACVPAQYSPELRGRWEELFKNAGSALGFKDTDNNVRSRRRTGLYLASEPEAAAAFDIQSQLERPLKDDETQASRIETLLGPMIIVDIGHGTSDYGLYVPKQITPFVRMDEGLCPSGDFFGSMVLDEEFRKHFCTRFGDEIPVFLAQQGKENSKINRELLIDGAAAEFERGVKKKFGTLSARSESMLVNIPHIHENLLKGIRRGCVEISKESVEAIFGILLDHIERSITRLVKDFEATQKPGSSELRVRRIVLFGGTSGNDHVLRGIRSRFSHGHYPGRCSYSIEAPYMRFDNEENLAVAKGACLRDIDREGLGHALLGRSLGSLRTDVWVEGRFRDVDTNINPIDGVKEVLDVVHWTYKINEMILANRSYTRRLRGHYQCSARGPVTVEREIVASAIETRDNRAISQIKDIKSLGFLRIRLTEEDRKDFHHGVGKDGEAYHLFCYEVKIGFDHMLTWFEFIIPYDGRIRGYTNPKNLSKQESWRDKDWHHPVKRERVSLQSESAVLRATGRVIVEGRVVASFARTQSDEETEGPQPAGSEQSEQDESTVLNGENADYSRWTSITDDSPGPQRTARRGGGASVFISRRRRKAPHDDRSESR